MRMDWNEVAQEHPRQVLSENHKNSRKIALFTEINAVRPDLAYLRNGGDPVNIRILDWYRQALLEDCRR